jgi:hypothetical protein
MIDRAFAERFAAEWIEAWNNHNLEQILAHYEDDFDRNSGLSDSDICGLFHMSLNGIGELIRL